MHPDKKRFLDVLAKDRYDCQTRLIFADWLNEHGEDDAADEQRYMAGDEWIASAHWIEKYADSCGVHCTNYSAVWNDYFKKTENLSWGNEAHRGELEQLSKEAAEAQEQVP